MKRKIFKRPRIFYGYWILVAAFFCLLIFSGTAFYGFSLFVTPLETEFNWSRGGIMTGYTIYMLLSAALSPIVGRLIDRYGAQKVIATGALISGLGFIVLTKTSNLSSFYLGWAIVGGGSTATGIIPTALVVSNWFKKRRGFAIGLMGTGIGAGGFILAPLIGGYLIPNFGWSTSYLAIAIITWLLVPISLLVIRTKPSDMGLYPDGAQSSEIISENATKPSAPEGLSLKAALYTATFWLIATNYLINPFSHAGTVQSQVPYLEDIGFPVATASAALGGVGLGSLVGKFAFGWLCDKIHAKYVCAIGCSLQLIAILILNSVQPDSPVAMLWLYAVIMGLGIGSWLPTMSMLISTNFGLASYGIIFGVTSMALNIGAAIGPLVAGHMYDTMHTYHQAFIAFAALYAVAIPAILAVRRPKAKE